MYRLSKNVVLTLVVLLGLAVLSGQAQQQTTGGTLVVSSFGGQYQEAQRKAFFEPYAKRYGVRVVEDTNPSLERLQAEVRSGRPSIDVATGEISTYTTGVEQNLWEPVDYKSFDPADIKAMPAEVRQVAGVGTIWYSEGLAFSTKAFPDPQHQPGSWADFWDVNKFPGKRAVRTCDSPGTALPEMAMLASGVPTSKIYPIDLSIVTEKIKEIAPNALFIKDVAPAGEMLISGEAVMSQAPNGRIQQLIDKGAPLKFVWNQARSTFDLWYILRGTPNKVNAERFLAFASSAKAQADIANIIGYGPVNTRAFQYIGATTAKKLPTYPANFKQSFLEDNSWWTKNRQKWLETCTAAVLK
jgi:putative spermidine/putrescine transport system substrate-binding protein